MTAPEPHLPPHQAAYLSARQAAVLLGVNEKTVRRWIDRGELAAVKATAGTYRIDPAALDRYRADHAAVPPRRDAAPAADSVVPLSQTAAPVDLSPLVGHIATLEDRVQQLTEAATVWQLRAVQAEDRLKQLTAGNDAAVAAQNRPGATEPPALVTDTLALRWRRWWRRMLEGP